MSFTICLAPAQTIEYSQGGVHLWVYLNWALARAARSHDVMVPENHHAPIRTAGERRLRRS